MPVQPLKPSQVEKKKHETMPDGVIEAFNEMIAKNWDGYSSEFKQDDVVTLILVKTGEEREQTVYDNGWLDVEGIYRKAGWQVEYDKPAYCESYPATFKFKKKK